jgi:ATP-dependent DNA helicase DinG
VVPLDPVSGPPSARDAGSVFSHGGLLARKLDGYEPRDGQVLVAEAVERALRQDQTLLCEAGTGIGKTYAYLVPALLSGRKVIVSTATRTLQEQIFHRDLPLIQAVLGTDVPVALMKGLPNYLCRRRHAEQVFASTPDWTEELRELGSWVERTKSGDLSELGSWQEEAPLRRRVASGADTRVGPGCAYYDECFVTLMRKEAQAAQLVVVNHHLFFADLALRGPHPGRVLPDYDAVIFDEAHQIEDIAATFFGSRVRTSSAERLLSEASGKLSRTAAGATSAALSLVDRARQGLRTFFSELAITAPPGRSELDGSSWSRALKERYFALDNLLDDVGAVLTDYAALTDDASVRDGLTQLQRRVLALREHLEAAVTPAAGHVAFIEVSGGEVSVGTTPVDLAEILRPRLFEAVPAVALLSATLSAAGQGKDASFTYVRERLGLGPSERVLELSVPSPFDFQEQCLLYLPKDLPPPAAPDFLEHASTRARSLIEMTAGGAFVLTTSLASMKALATRLGPLLPELKLLVQGDRPKEALLEEFRADRNAVLVATASFWEGVDVPGEALRLVILEKIPFAVPTDPVVRARGALLEEQGKNAFLHLTVPEAAISLKQGFGRLIRRRQDHGVVALLDDRIRTKSYGRRLLAALPPAQRTDDLERVREFVRSWPKASSDSARRDASA